ncbi:MAG TPA: hypothetical protein VFD44_04940 [Hanamia sp.]|nr:hypothetical protein [Hanamia sp.]
MKRTLLISTALIFSAASFAQTTVNNSQSVKGAANISHNKSGTQVNSSANASSATSIHSSVVQNAKSGATEQIKEDNQAMASEKQAIAAKAKTKGQKVAKAAKLKGNNTSENSSISGNASSSASVNGKLKSSENESVHATLKGDNRSEVAVEKIALAKTHKVEASTKNAVHTTVTEVHTVKVKPVKVNTAARVNSAAVVRIR